MESDGARVQWLAAVEGVLCEVKPARLERLGLTRGGLAELGDLRQQPFQLLGNRRQRLRSGRRCETESDNDERGTPGEWFRHNGSSGDSLGSTLASGVRQ
jgi:hypothetical protein